MSERNSVADTMARSSAEGGGDCFKRCSKIDLDNIAESENQKKKEVLKSLPSHVVVCSGVRIFIHCGGTGGFSK